MEVREDDSVAMLDEDSRLFTSDDASFALWLNTAFRAVGRDDDTVREDLLTHGLMVDGVERRYGPKRVTDAEAEADWNEIVGAVLPPSHEPE